MQMMLCDEPTLKLWDLYRCVCVCLPRHVHGAVAIAHVRMGTKMMPRLLVMVCA